MAKDKTKNKKDKKKKDSGGGRAAKATKTVKALAENPFVADIIAAALVATASALKDSKTARALAEHAGEEIEALAKKGTERGNALWQLALEVGRRALDELGDHRSESGKKARTKAASDK